MDRGSSGGGGLHSIKDIAADVTEGFCELMDKTRSQMEELDPLEAHLNQREIFKKNLQGLKERRNCSEDSDSGVGVSSSSSGINIIAQAGVTNRENQKQNNVAIKIADITVYFSNVVLDQDSVLSPPRIIY